jgi:hypothetical protein
MTTFLYGAYGTGNLGDDLLLKGALLDHYDKQVKIVSYGLPKINGLTCFLEHFDFLKNPEKYLECGDTLAFAGGGLFWAGSHCNDMMNVAVKAKEIGCRVEIKRIGAQGFHSNTVAVRALMAIADEISVRDENSVEILRQYDVTDRAVYLPDYVLTLGEYIKNEFPKTNENHKKVRVGINHSATPFYHNPEHRKKSLHIYSHIAHKYANDVDFLYIPHTRHFNCIDQNDVIYAENFWHASRGLIATVNFPDSIDDLLRLYSGLDGAIGWRYHLLVLAKLFDIDSAFLGSSGGHKYGAFARENNVPQIDFDLNTNMIIQSFSRWIERLIQSKKHEKLIL